MTSGNDIEWHIYAILIKKAPYPANFNVIHMNLAINWKICPGNGKPAFQLPDPQDYWIINEALSAVFFTMSGAMFLCILLAGCRM
jgi:hypothetical protein